MPGSELGAGHAGDWWATPHVNQLSVIYQTLKHLLRAGPYAVNKIVKAPARGKLTLGVEGPIVNRRTCWLEVGAEEETAGEVGGVGGY